MPTLRRAAIALGLTACVVAGAPPASPAFAQDRKQEPAAKPMDVVIFKNGRRVEGEILKTTDTAIEMRVVVAGISTVTTYNRSEILEIQRAAPAPAKEPAPATPATPAPARAAEATPATAPGAASDKARVYVATLEGTFGRDVSETPIRRVLEDAATHDPDVIVLKIDSTQNERVGFNGLFRAEHMTPIIADALAKGQRIVFWVEEATVGAAFLPMISPEIYFTSEGKMGGIGTLQDFNIGDAVVNEKQISLRLGHAEGIAIAGGYPPELVSAMARSTVWLSVRFRGGKPEFLTERAPTEAELADGWIVLTDDGEGENEDSLEDAVRGRGNDVLTLNAEWAQRLGVCDGVADELDDLVYQLRLGRDYEKIEGRSENILEDWTERVKRAGEDIQRLMQREQELPQKPGEDPKTFLGRKINLLNDASGLLAVYSEVFDREGDQRSQIRIRIDDYRRQIQQISRAERDQQRR